MRTIDLHGVRHAEVQKLLDQFLWEQMKMDAFWVEIVTGNSERMKEIVGEILKEYGFTWVVSITNSGTIIAHIK